MKVPPKYYDEIFNFKGQWDVPSCCGLKIIKKDKVTVIVTELYQDNTGTSVTAAGSGLAKQICQSKNLNMEEIIYIECNPDTSSKLSFYDEEFFMVSFKADDKPSYRQLSREEVKNLFYEGCS